jgi:hypothetical protein
VLVCIREYLPGELGSRRVTQLEIGVCVMAGIWGGLRHHDLMVEGVLSCAHDLRVRRRALLVASLPRVEKGGVGSGRELVQRLA